MTEISQTQVPQTEIAQPQVQTPAAATPPRQKSQLLKYTKKTLKRIIPLAILTYFLPRVLLVYAVLGLLDAARNRPFNLGVLNRYFFGKGVLTWVLSPFNLLMDLISLPYWNKGIYKLSDLPKRYQAEVQELIDAAHHRDIVGALESKMGEKKRGMFFFQWYGKMLGQSVDIPEYKKRYKYIRTIGVSIFNKKQSTGLHFGPLRVTFRVLYNINTIDSPDVYVRVGDVTHRWRDEKLFIFDDTLEHESHNESDALRYCLFVDMLRPSPVPWVMSGIVTGIRLLAAPVRMVFYSHWTVIK